MKNRMVKWVVMTGFILTALTGCYIHHDRDDDYYRYRDYRRDYGYRDGWHRDYDGWRRY